MLTAARDARPFYESLGKYLLFGLFDKVSTSLNWQVFFMFVSYCQGIGTYRIATIGNLLSKYLLNNVKHSKVVKKLHQ